MRAAFEASFVGLTIADLGWARAARTAPADLLTDHPEATPARVVRVDRGRLLLVASGDGSLAHVRDQTPDHPDGAGPTVVGDWVLVEPPSLEAGGYGFARARLPRGGVLARRRTTDSTRPQVLAANLDLVLVAEALAPDRTVNEARVARFVAIAAAGDVDVHVVLTNADRVEPASVPSEVAGAPATATSVVDGQGIDAVRELLAPGSTATIVGASGAGKSSLVNALVGEPVLAVGGRRSSGTGRHVTSVSRLVPLAHGALLVDTPGVRLVGMHAGVDASVLAPMEISALADQCRFRDCHHDGEPGCAVAAAIEAGNLPVDAIATWRKLEREALREQARVDDRLRRELNAGQRAIGREVERARRRGEIVERRR